jgi:hypothetical protein
VSFLAFDVGCIECGEDSTVVGVFESKQEAIEAARERAKGEGDEPPFGYFSGGQHSVEVFNLGTVR